MGALLMMITALSAGGILVNGKGHSFVMKHNRPIFGVCFDLLTINTIDRPPLIGSAIFGIGWSLAGFCPRPVMASLLPKPADRSQFLVTLLAGVFIGCWLRSQGYKG